ncbi:hypothetical protein F4604DRAFT_2006196 [Suillus subluteus]|nr:hypothetical protein F4604DRAFT_2006196 [Suillus subluteus]
MSTTDAPHHTRPSTALARPAKIVLDAKIKRWSPGQKAADDLVIKEAKEAKEAAHQKGVECIAALQAEMEKIQKEVLTKKATPVQPKPKPKAIKPKAAQTKSVVGDIGSGDSPADSGLLDDLVVSETDVAEDVGDKSVGKGKKTVTKRVAKTLLIRDAISNYQHIHTEIGIRWPGSECTASSTPTSAADLPTKIPATSPQIPDGVPEDALTGAFADDIDDLLECEDVLLRSKQNKGKSKVVALYEEDYDVDEPEAPLIEASHDSDDELMALLTQGLVGEQYSQEPRAPFTQVDNYALKRKASEDLTMDDDESLVSQWSMEIDGNPLAAELVEDPIMSSDEAPLPAKPNTVKEEKVLHTTYLTSVTASQAAVNSKPPAHKKPKVESSTPCAHGTPATTCQQNMDTTPDNIKTHGAYRTVDLPAAMQVDQRWVKNFIPTIMLWARSYEDIWSIPDEVLLHHTQLVFNVVYSDLDIVIVHGGVMHSLTAQRISEWCSNFGSTGLLFGTAHLNTINGYVEIKRAVTMITHKELKAENVLSSVSRGWFSIRLPKILNKATGKETNVPFLFLAARWTKPTNFFIKSLLGKPPGYLETMIQMARATLNEVTETLLGSLDKDKSEDNQHAMISPTTSCPFPIPLVPYVTGSLLNFVLIALSMYPY